MNEFMPPAGIIAALALATISPGPGFIVVARTAVAKSRALVVAAGFAMGIGGLTLRYLRYRIIRAARHPIGLSASRPRCACLSYKAWINGAAGAAMGVWGIKLLYSI